MKETLGRKGGGLLSHQEFWILSSLLNDPKHGYAIAKHVSELSDGKVTLSAATLYENLSRMLDSGLIERDGEKDIVPGRPRKVYRISGLGVRVVNEQWHVLTKAGRIIANTAGGEAVSPLWSSGV